MNLIILPGASTRNRDWVVSLKESFEPLFDEIYSPEYAHWETGGSEADIDTELINLQKRSSVLGEYVVFAKCIGTVIVANAIQRGILTPKRCVFLGVPLVLIDRLNISFGEMIGSTNIVFLQNEFDPLGSHEAVSEYLSRFGREVIKLPGDTHNYFDTPLFLPYLAEAN